MRKTTLVLTLSALSIVPAALVAQASVSASARTQTSVTARTPRTSVAATSTTQANAQASSDVLREFSAEGRARLEATYQRARAQHVPEQPVRDRVAEGQAKGAAEAQIVASAAHVESRLEASQQAMIRAGRARPSDGEVQHGASAMEQGVTSAQIEALVARAPSDRSLVVALDVLGSLTARGVPATQALVAVQTQLAAHASDEAIASLATNVQAGAQGTGQAVVSTGRGAVSGTTTTGGSVGSTVSGTAGGVGATGGAAGTVTGGVGSSVGTAGGVTGGVTGTVTGVVKKP